jgi:drug/metabolite transporter (DMT)-like permease
MTQRRSIFKSTLTWSYKSVGAIAIAAFGGTYLGIWLQQIALKLSPAGIAQTLLATSPLFVLPIVALLGEKITLRATVGVSIAIAGIALLFNP